MWDKDVEETRLLTKEGVNAYTEYMLTKSQVIFAGRDFVTEQIN